VASDSEDKDGTYTNISGATEKTYKLVAADVGKYIKVKATGTGDYKGTVESVPFGPIAEELVPEVSGSIERDPGNTGGDLQYNIENDTVTFTSGEIKWYPEDKDLGRAAGNRVGVQINAPADFDTTGVTVKIGEQTYNWDEIEDGDGYFWWYPLVTEAGQQFTATVVWNESSTQEFKVVIGEGVTLEPAPDTTDPELVVVSPEAGDIQLGYGETFKLEVTASDENLYELEVDHSFEGTLPEFSVYASESDPYGGQGEAFAEAGVTVTYNADAQKWTIDFGPTVTQQIVAKGGITFYLVLVDEAGNKWGSMDPTTPENTFAYTVTQDEAPEVSGSIERDPGNTGGDLQYNIENDTVTFTSGEIKWYPEDKDLGRAAGNRVGVQINAPADFDTTGVTVKIGEQTYNWDEIEDGDGYFWWYPLVTEAGQQFTATVVWNESSTQEFKVVIGEGVTLEPAPDTTDPELVVVSPEAGDIQLGYGETFKLEVTASDENLYELEVDHSFEGTLPEFSVYASESDPYGGQGEAFAEAGVTVTYNAAEQKWTIDFGPTVTQQIVAKGGITFYLVLVDEAGNKWGSMDPTTPENTFAYTVTQDEAPEVSGSIERDPGNTGGDLQYNIENDTVTFTSGEIKWYPEDKDLGRAAGNRVGVQINAPADFDTTGVTVKIGEQTYNWDEIEDGDGYFWWYPLVTEAGQQFTATVVWNESSTQEFKVVIGEGVTLEPAPDTTDPELVVVSPEAGDIQLGYGETFKLEVTASDENLYELEVDHSFEGTLPEFSVYASESDPYGGQGEAFAEAGVTVTYNADAQKWTIDFGPTVTQQIVAKGGITFYLVLVDEAGNKWGSMDPTTPENTFAYTVTQDEAPEVSGSIERDPGNTGGDLQYNIENDTVTFTSGEIKWYPEDKDLGRAAGNRVGVQINAPADFDTTGVTVKIGEQTYNWDEIEDGDGYFWWYPLVTEAGQQFTATVVWNESSTQEFKVVIGEGVTLEPAPDTTDPELVVVSPEAGDIQLGYGETFKLEVTASDENLYELEVDHSFEGTLPEFSVYASESDPYGGQGEAFAEAGVTVTYNADAQKWTIDFGPTVTQQIVAKGGITFYLVLVDEAGNKWGSMDPTTPENTFAYTVTQDEAPEVSGSIERDPGNTGGDLQYNIENDTVTFTSGEIKWYPEDKDLGRAAGNRVGVQINAPADFDTTGVTVKIGEQTYNWDEIEDGDGYFWWYPLVTEAGQQFTATVVWNESSTQEFKVVIGEGVTLEPAPDTTDPELVVVSPEAGDIQLGYGETFKLEVTASDENLYELEVDHSFEGTLPEFSVYASESDPYGGQGEAFAEAGVTVTYNADAQKWTIDFGPTVTQQIVAKGGITFYLVLVDEAGNKWGSMDPTTPENTFAYTVTQDEAPEVSGSIERDPGNTGGDLQYNIENDTVTFTSGEIKWYPEDKDLGRAAGNRVGVQINAPADFDTTGVTVKIGEQTYNWDEIEDGDGYFWWYPLVTEAGQQFTATVVWNESSTQEFKVVIGEGVTLEPAPDTTDPELVVVSPEAGDIQLGYGETFKLEVTASDENLYELEVDHSFEGTLPEFSVYASESDPYGGQGEAFAEAGVTVTYNADAQKWTIDFGPTVTQQIVAKGGITFYLVLVDEAGNKWGSMDPTTPENTFAYTVTQDEAPEVSGSIERDPGNTGGDLQYNIENDTVTFTSGEIKWYPEDKDLGRAAGNRVGVQINAPADFDTTGVTVKIGEQTYNWDEIEDGDGYFWWYPLVTEAGQQFTATVVWNESSTQEFKVVIGEGVTLEPAPDTTDPELVVVSPEAGDIQLGYGETFKLEVTASDENLYELEVDHSFEGTLPEFSVYASESDPYGGQGEAFAEAGVTVTYNADAQKWTIDFGPTVTQQIVAKGGITFYLVLVDEAGNKWGSMDPTTPENTFAYTVTQDEAPEVSGSIERDPGNTGGDLQYNIENDTVTFTSGEIKWYPEDKDLGRAAGNRVGVQINAPADFDTTGVTVKIGEQTYNWDEIEDGDGYFWWYPLVTEAGQQFTATVVWNESSTQEFKVVIGEGVTLEPAPDTTDPELVVVSPEAGDIQLGYGETFKLEVTASDENLYELEVDHSFEGTLPEFSVYASESDPYGGQGEAFAEAGVTVTYNADAQKWTIDFGPTVTQQIVAKGGITFYLVLVDEAGNKWGSMDPTTPENTFAYTVTQDEAPEVSGSIERDPGNTGGDLQYNIENDTVTFTSGEIKWYPEDKDLGRAAGNRVGVQINAPADFDTTGVTVKIGEQTYNWDEIEDGDGYFWWYPLVTEAGQQFTATVVWNESSTQEFKVVIGEGVTLEPAPDTTDPELVVVSPEAGDIQLGYGETFKLEVTASDENLYELEVDHSFEGTLPEFSVYASESDPYGGQGEAFAEAGVTVTYNADAQKWTIDFGPTVTQQIVAKGGITFYLVLVDEAGNKWGSMDPTTPENTFAYTVTQDEAPEVSGSIERDPGNTGGDLQYNIENDTVTFTSGEIKWYPEDKDLGRAAGNRVGVQINAPADFDTTGVTVKIGEQTYNWDEIEDGDGYFWWYPLVTEAGQQFTATVVWNESSTQEFKVVIGEGVTLEPAPDTTDPELVVVSPEAGDIQLGYGETFKLEVTASDENLYELEVDHSFEGTLPEFSVYASESDPYGGQGEAFAEAGVTVTYNADAQKWTIDFGPTVTQQIVAKGGITFYLVLVDEAGNKWGSMDPTTPENTFAYTVTQDEAPEVSGSIERDPGNTGGDLQYNIENDTVTFTSGEIKWYPEDKDLGRAAGNRVGVQINAPADFDTTGVTVKIGEQTYNWDEIEDGDGYFWWYPLVTEAGQQFTATVVWNESSTQEFKVVIGEGVTLEPAPDTTDPELVVVSPEAGDIQLGYGETFKLEVTASDENLYELEVDHSFEGTLPEFSVYASESDPYGGQGEAFAEAGVTVTYNADAQKWTIDFGPTVTQQIVAKGGITFYLVLVDEAGNKWGSMDPTTPENTFAYTVTQDEAPEVSGSIERDPGNTGGDLQYNIENDTVTFTSGEIKWYPEDKDLGRAAGNRVGVQINAPADFDTTGVTVKIGEQTYNWDEIEDGDGYFWWYPLVTEAGQQFTATVVWNESSTQEFKVVIGEGVTLEPAPDTTDPELVVVSPEAGDIQLGYGETFKLEVTASDENLYELEVDHSFEGTLPEFSVYASESDPYGGQGEAFAEAGVTVTYNADAQKWTIDFGPTVTQQIVAKGGITFYLVLVDEAGNKWGSMDPTTPENTFAYTVTQDEAPEVSGSIERDPGNTGGDLQYNIENDTVTFTSGEIKWYPEDKDLGRAAGNRVGVQINAPADFDTTGVTVKIGEQTYNWDEIEDGDGYFWWYPLVTEAGQQFTATVVWNESSTQEFKVVIGEGVTLEPAPDTTDPELVVVSPEAGDIQLGYGETFKLEVTASDENLYELEVDHSFEGTLPEFSVYASESDPYGGQGEAFAEAGVTVTYNADAQKWTIDFGPTVTQQIVAKGGITFYLVLVDEAGNKWGSMDPTTPENTFAYTVTQDEAPEVSGSIERDPGNTGGDLQYNIENDTVTFTSGEIKWYPEDKDLGRAAGNRVGVQINAPADFDTTGVTVKIGEQTYNWDEIEDGDGYFWWYPLVTEAGQQFTATVVWNESSTQEFKVVIGEGVTLEPAPDTTDPELVVVSPEAGDIQLGYGETFKLEVTASDENLYELEVDHSFEGTLPEFSVYASESDPYGGQGEAFAEAGVTVTYNADAQKWTIDFGPTVTQQIVAKGGITFYLVLVDEAGNKWGSMDPTTPENTFAYTVTQDEAPEVSGSIERDPGNTGGDLQYNIENDTVTFTSGEIKWYPEDKDLGRAAGNRVGVQINAPADFDTTGVTVKIGEQTYNWDEIEDGDGYFWWYPLVTEAGQQFTATVVWNESSTQEFKVVIGEGVTLEPAPDTTDPELVVVSPEAGDIQLGYGETFKLEVTASDENLYELEVDHSFEGTLPEFSVYASESDPYGGQGEAFAEAGVTVTYNADAQKWTIDFGPTVTQQIVAKGGITFYLVLVDEAGNKWGSMDPTTPENTFAYTVTQDEAPEVSGSIERDPGNTGGDLQYNIENDTVTFTSGEIKWYPEDKDLGRAAGNRVGVQINAPADFDTTGVTVKIGEQTYNWDEIEDGDGYFWWYPLVTEAGQQFTATVVWNESSTQEFKVVIGEGVTLEPAPDTTDPELVVVSPEAGDIQLGYGETFKLEVTASDENLYELEVDHSFEGTLPEFSVYASESDPYGGQGEAFAEAGVTVTYNADAQKWTIDFGPTVTQQIVAKGGITFYLVLVDEAGNKWGSMDPTTPENTFAYTVTQDEAPEVSGSIERDPGNTGGDLQYNIENDTVTFTSGEIKWYPEDKDLGRAAGNRVGVQINAPADFDTTGVTVKIGEQTYNWDEIEDGDGYFWWYPLVTEAGQQFTATVVWNESSTQEFKVVIGEGVTLEPAPDTTDPELVVVSPEAGDIQLGYGETFKLEVTASDENLYELEVDHSFEGTLPEFSVYASESDPYGGQGEAFAEAGVTVTYNADAQKWTIDFGPTVTQQIVAKGGITFYLVLVDEAGNKWGSMDPTTPENTFKYNVTQDKVPDEAQFVWDVNRIEGEGNMSEKLSELGNTAYEALETVQKVEVAKLFILNRPDEGFADIAAIETALGTAINQYNNLLGAVNAADTVDSMKTALEAIGELFGINVTDLMAQAALDAKGDGYESVSAIIAVIQSDVAKAAFLNYLEGEVDKIDVAEVVIDGENITVTFDRDAKPTDVLQAANELVAALKGELYSATLILNNDETNGGFDLADEGVAAQIALYLLNGTSPAEFLKGLETIEASYTAEAIDQDGIPFTLAGELVFQVAAPSDDEIAAAKAAFLAYLEDRVKDIDVADVVIDIDEDGENITVTFDRDAKPTDVLQAANELVAALKGELYSATLILNNDETNGGFDLADEGVAAQIALYLLNGTSPAEFLKGLETIEASYTAEAIDQDGIPFTLAGELVFQVAAPSDDEIAAAKAAFLAYLEDRVKDIDVADVVIDIDEDGENITVTFDRDAKPTDVLQAANELVAALKGELYSATLILNNDETNGGFDLADEGVAAQIALYLLNGTSPAEFLKGLETIEASYTAEAIDQDGIPFTLAGELVFQVAAPSDDEIAAAKAAFLAYLEDRVKDIDVADVVIDIDEDGENITVTFDRDAKPTDVLQAANELVAALKGELYSATLILNNDETNGGFDLADEGVAAQIALYLLNGTSPAEFLKGLETIEASYTAEAIDQDGIPFTLAGELVFQVAAPSDDEIAAAKAAFLAYLEDRVKDIDVADVVIDIDEDGENITVTFDRDAKPTDVLQAANELVAALKGELYSATLILNNDETNGGFDLADEGVAAQIALYLLNGTSPAEFLKGLETIEASYTAEAIDQDGIPFTLAGELVFQVAAPSDDEIAAAKAAFLAYLEDRVKDIDVADVVIDIDEDGENITVTFDRDAKPTDVLQAANELVAALKGELYSATLILNNDETNGGFDLADEGVAAQIALYLLNGTSPAEFLKGLETIEASYTAEAIDQDGIPFTLAGELVFQVAAPSDDEIAAAKAAFLAYLEDRVKDIDVADVVIDIDEDGENITVTFFDLETADVVDIALYLLGDLSPSDFLAGEQTIAASYTATATVEGVTFSLAGTLKFQAVADPAVAAKAAFLAALADKAAEMDVAEHHRHLLEHRRDIGSIRYSRSTA
jgi:uncharacterized protein YuzE